MTVLVNCLVAVGMFAAFSFLARAARSWKWQPARLAALLDSRWAPAVLGLVTFAAVRFVWRSFGEPGVIHDERAYLLQAEIFARGRWTAPAPPIAAFFEQMHVFIEPAVFAKYPPAHAMMLVPGIWLGMPGLIPALNMGLAGALTFWLARRLSNAWTALLTWMLWTTAPVTLVWATSYLSESTTTVMWLAAASATVLWLESGEQLYLVGVAAAIAWGYEARPLTMLALAVPIGFVIVRRLIAVGRWRTAAVPALVATTLLALGPLWNHHTAGDWRVDPYPLYSQTYFPFDKPGFGIDPTPPLRPLPAELLPMDAWSREVHQIYMPSAVPLALVQRVLALLAAYSFGWRFAIGALLLGSLIRARGVARLILAASGALLTAYLAFAHPPGWVVYYFELLPALHFLAAIGLVRLLGQSRDGVPDRGTQMWAPIARSSAVAALLLLPFCLSDLARVRAAIDARNEFHRRADQVIRAAPANSIVFVRYPASHNPHLAITRNEVDLAAARSWVVYDRGAENARLLSFAPDRRPYMLDASTLRLEPMPLTDVQARRRDGGVSSPSAISSSLASSAAKPH